jgi:Flp pilus assembly protein TadG
VSRARDDSGTAIVEFVWLAVLLLIPLVYVVLGVFEVQRAAYAASTAARSAGRAFVTAPSEAAARPRAQSAARLAFEDQGLAGAPLGLDVTCSPSPTNCLAPGSVVSIEVRSSVALPLFPVILGRHTPRIAVSAVHTSPYGTYRNDRP